MAEAIEQRQLVSDAFLGDVRRAAGSLRSGWPSKALL
jgi:hypothetical protein